MKRRIPTIEEFINESNSSNFKRGDKVKLTDAAYNEVQKSEHTMLGSAIAGFKKYPIGQIFIADGYDGSNLRVYAIEDSSKDIRSLNSSRFEKA
ncbi:MAG: hypothetical protein WC979_02415 [Candidatus Pacearchaeota archaeon]|jgi:hypothetical protein|nr:hypothetical protein [Clostridia bacterium]